VGVKRVFVAVAVFSLIVVSCSEQPTWEKGEVGQAAFDEDSAECKKTVPMNGYFGSGIGATPTLAAAMKEAYARCMQGKGWNVRFK